MTRFLIFFAIILSVFYFYPSLNVYAAPNIASFSITPSSGSSGYPFSATWSLEDAGGSSIVVPCIDGIKAKSDTGATIACDIKVASAAATGDGLLLKLINITGFQKSISIKLVPKDIYGKDQDTLAKFVSVSVSPESKVIDFFKTSSTTVLSGKTVTLSWDIPEATGANISMECKEHIRAASPSYSGNLPCGKQIFSPALGKSGSLDINFTNSSEGSVPVVFTLYPAIGTNVYNGINTGSVTIDVASDIAPDPVVSYFKTISSHTVLSGDKVELSWGTENAKGINLKISCADAVTATSSVEPSIDLPCDKYAFGSHLNPAGQISLVFQNKSSVSKNLTVSLYPSFADKEGYDATKSKGLSFEIKPANYIPPSSAASASTQVPTAIPSSSPVNQVNPTVAPANKPATTQKQKSAVPSPTAAPASIQIEEIVPQAENELLVPETEDGNKEIIDEHKISSRLLDRQILDEIASVELNADKKQYSVTGHRRVKLFYVIPVKIKIGIVADALSGEVMETHFSWWSFLVNW